MFPKKFRNIFVAETMFPSLPTCFQMYPTRKTLFSRLNKFKKCFKSTVQIYINITLRFVRANVSQQMFPSSPSVENMTKHRQETMFPSLPRALVVIPPEDIILSADVIRTGQETFVTNVFLKMAVVRTNLLFAYLIYNATLSYM